MASDAEPVDVSPEDAECHNSESGTHSDQWWLGHECANCGATALADSSQRIEMNRKRTS